jgi:hypothetical protein
LGEKEQQGTMEFKQLNENANICRTLQIMLASVHWRNMDMNKICFEQVSRLLGPMLSTFTDVIL